MKQVIGAFRKFSVVNLGKTYAAMRITDVAQRTSSTPTDLSETADYVKALVASGELKASITETGNDPGTWVLRFIEEADEEFSEADKLAEITRAKDKIDTLRARIQEADRKLGLSREYLEYTKKTANQKGTNEQMSDDFMTIDEDMMVDT